MHEAVVATHSFAERAGIDDATRARLAIIVEELVTNLYDHGGLGPEDVFELELASSATELGLVLTAPGPRFDPRLSAPRRTPSHGGAGAGLRLAKAWSSRIEHDYAEGRNRLALVLPMGEGA